MIDLRLGDCLEVMKTIENNSIDAIICDLPYGKTACKWDSVIPFDLLWEQYNRIIKDNGVILLYAQQPFASDLINAYRKYFRYVMIWEKTKPAGFFNAKKMPMKSHENILVFYKKLPTYNPQMTNGHKPMNSYTKKASVQNKTKIYGKVDKDVSGGGETIRYPRSVQIFPSDKQKNKLNGTIHPTQKPLKLIEFFIKSYTNKDDLVLDNVAGSGTVAVACENLERNYIVIEKEIEYYNIILKRLEINKNL
jgi:site-specific DNA-methyltransferase (adenine-specific)